MTRLELESGASVPEALTLCRLTLVATMTLDVLSWAVLAAYVVHLLDETLINGGFVAWVRTNFWPGYTMGMFFWFNAGAVGLVAAGNVAFDLFGGHLVVLPLFSIAQCSGRYERGPSASHPVTTCALIVPWARDESRGPERACRPAARFAARGYRDAGRL
jgi:hypothetical protein